MRTTIQGVLGTRSDSNFGPLNGIENQGGTIGELMGVSSNRDSQYSNGVQGM